MNRWVLLVGTLIVLPLVVVLALGLGKDPSLIESPLIGRPAPDFALTSLDGERIRLEELRGTPVVLNFWATWCQPCVWEHPVLLAGSREYRGQVRFLGVVYQDRPELIRQFLASNGAWGPSLVDEGSKAAIAYGVYGAPETFFVDSDGVVVEKITGPVEPEVLRRVVEGML